MLSYHAIMKRLSERYRRGVVAVRFKNETIQRMLAVADSINHRHRCLPSECDVRVCNVVQMCVERSLGELEKTWVREEK
jgi:hypothetical protein